MRNIKISVVLLAAFISSFAFAQTQALPHCVTDRINDPNLIAPGDTKIYAGQYLDAISMPIGGIGTGCIQINGQAEREIWQIFNNYCDAYVPDSFFAIRCLPKNQPAVIRTLQTTAAGPFEKMQSLTFRGEYPFGWYDFADPNLPLNVTLETFNPLIPLNAKDSAIPCAIFNITVTNPTDSPIEVSLLATQQNAAGFMCSEQQIWPGPADGILFEDFEAADLGQWTPTGQAFATQPLQGKINPEQNISNFKGSGLINTYGPERDIATGTLTSPTFTITKDFINFLIGGGDHPGKTCVNLYVDDQIVKTETGSNSDALYWVSWQVADLKGKQAHFEIVDNETGGWGHIDIDNIVFSDESKKSFKPKIKGLGQNINQVAKNDDSTLIHFTTARKPYDADPEQAEKLLTALGVDKSKYNKGIGDMSLMVLSENAQSTASWPDLQALHQTWLTDNILTGPNEIGPSDPNQTYNAALAVPFTLKPSQSRTITFILTWNFPHATHGLNNKDIKLAWEFKGNKYSNWWSDSTQVASYVKDNLKNLTDQTRLYHDTFYASNLPHWLLDRISSQTAILSSKTFFWAANDYVGCWEGCCPTEGCCHGNCSHVYQYAQTHARLFPSLARKIREQTFSYQREDGFLTNRDGWEQEAIDAMCGEILGAYREHLMTDSNTWIDTNWPHVKNAMNYVIGRWDADEDGMLTGLQHNTLDTELSGCTSWLGSLYLSALAASEKIANLENEPELAKRYREIIASGAKKQNDTLWNGEYYIQIPEPNLMAHNYITGCSIDQVLGEWWANLLGLDGHYPPERVRSALNSLLRYNFKCSFVGVEQKPRKFVSDNDAGMQMICWPNKWDRPAEPLFYAEEVMSGFEYSAAAAMVQFGMLKEGFMVTKAIYDRYDGRLRTDLTNMNVASWGYSGNPFGDDECGKFYGRAMSVWSLLLACQGFDYNGPEKIIGFDPQWQPENHASFFTAANGWGLFEQKRTDNSQKNIIKIAYGKVDLTEVRLTTAPDRKIDSCDVTMSGKHVTANLSQNANKLYLKFPRPLTINAGDTLEITLSSTGH